MAATTYNNQSTTSCPHCFAPVEQPGRFCGNCGAPLAALRSKLPAEGFAASFQRTTPIDVSQGQNSQQHATPFSAPRQTEKAPSFATQTTTKQIPKELGEEYGKLLVLLARERVFLIMHWCIFLTLNLTGFFLALKAYHGYIGDDMTKTIIAMTPLMFINSIALACLSPIKGTKREIARLKERLTYARFQLEYHSLFTE